MAVLLRAVTIMLMVNGIQHSANFSQTDDTVTQAVVVVLDVTTITRLKAIISVLLLPPVDLSPMRLKHVPSNGRVLMITLFVFGF